VSFLSAATTSVGFISGSAHRVSNSRKSHRVPFFIERLLFGSSPSPNAPEGQRGNFRLSARPPFPLSLSGSLRIAPRPYAIVEVHRHHADRVIAEVNNGGALVEATVRMVDPNVSYKAVQPAAARLSVPSL
jgi:hypothetical protein